MNKSAADIQYLLDQGRQNDNGPGTPWTWVDFESQPYNPTLCPCRAWNKGWGGQCGVSVVVKSDRDALDSDSRSAVKATPNEILVPKDWVKPYEIDTFADPFGEGVGEICKGHQKELTKRGYLWGGFYSQPPPNLTLGWKFKTTAGRGKKQQQGTQDNLLKLLEVKKQMFGEDLCFPTTVQSDVEIDPDPIPEDPIPEELVKKGTKAKFKIHEIDPEFILAEVERYFNHKRETDTCFADFVTTVGDAKQQFSGKSFRKKLSKSLGLTYIQTRPEHVNHAIFEISEVCERKGAMIWT